MLILLFRHGFAKPRDSRRFPDDDQRPLTQRGRKGVKQQAKSLIPLLPRLPGSILVSPTVRTLDTARIMADAFGLPARRLREMPELHHAYPPSRAISKVAQQPGKCLVLVGHEPWLSGFASLLLAGETRRPLLEIAKGGACLVEAEACKPGKGTLLFLLP